MHRLPASRLVLALLSLCVPVGCGSEGFTLAPVSGRVTVDGEPIEGLRVTMEPIGGPDRPIPGPDSTAFTDAEGRYTLSATAARPGGAVVGPCRVRISSPPARPDVVSDDRDPNYDPVAEIKAIKPQADESKPQEGEAKPDEKRPSRLIPLRYNENSVLTFTVHPQGTDKANFNISRK